MIDSKLVERGLFGRDLFSENIESDQALENAMLDAIVKEEAPDENKSVFEDKHWSYMLQLYVSTFGFAKLPYFMNELSQNPQLSEKTQNTSKKSC